MDSFMTFIIIACILSGNLVYFGEARRTWACTPCLDAEDCNEEPNDYCVWGLTRDNCGRKACARGPGERCGGPMDIYGRCTEGLMCKPDERCHGCAERLDRETNGYDCYPMF